MIYAGIDVNIITHERAVAAGPEAFGLWCWGMCWSQIHETDGRLPEVNVLHALGGQRRVLRRLAVRLVSVGLWIASEDGSFQVRNYTKKNQTADEITRRRSEKKSANAGRQQAWRERRAAGVTPEVTRYVTADVTPRNAPTTITNTNKPPTPSDQIRDHSTAVAVPTSRGTRLPAGWTPSAEAQAWAKAQGVADPLGGLLDDFRDYWSALPGAKGVKLDWDATFRNRVRQTHKPQLSPTPSRFGVPRQPIGSAATAEWMNPTQNFDFGASK